MIFVTPADLDHALEEEWNYATGLTEQVIYFRRPGGLLAKARKHLAWTALFRGAVKKYVAQHGRPHLVHVHVPWKAGLIAFWLKEKTGVRYIVSEHWGIYNNSVVDHLGARSLWVRRQLKKIYSHASKHIAVSEALAGDMMKAINIPAPTVLPNVVDTSLFFHKDEKYSRFSFIHVSNMVPLKNVDRILRAFKQLVQDRPEQQPQLILIGNRDHTYVDLAAELDLLHSSVFFKGEISYNEVAAEMRRCHCFVLFSDTETFSCVTAEALCAGLSVITRAAGALPELVNSTNGILLQPASTESLAASMATMMENFSRYDNKKIAAEAAEKYGYSSIAERFSVLYGDE